MSAASALNVDQPLVDVVDNLPVIVLLGIVVWLSLPQLAERFTIIGRFIRWTGLSKRWKDKAARLEKQRRDAAMEEARKLAAAAMREMTPPDVRRMEEGLRRLGDKFDVLEDSEAMLRAYVIYDELWHFHDDLDEARRGRRPAHRMPIEAFEQKWKSGWRPFDDAGRLVDDGSGGPTGNG